MACAATWPGLHSTDGPQVERARDPVDVHLDRVPVPFAQGGVEPEPVVRDPDRRRAGRGLGQPLVEVGAGRLRAVFRLPLGAGQPLADRLPPLLVIRIRSKINFTIRSVTSYVGV